MTTPKTAVTVLQELMIKYGETPEYKCIAQSGTQHQAVFEYQCIARGASVTALGRSKKEAKQEVARCMLVKLAAQGLPVPQPFANVSPGRGLPGPSAPIATPVAANSYVALLKELCDEYNLPAVDYDLVGDTGPPHLRHFTVKARMGMHERLATATTKKAARQMAAEQLYSFLRENTARITKDFVEAEALERSIKKSMDRYVETRELCSRPHLGQKVIDYHLGLTAYTDEEKLRLGIEALESTADRPAPARLEAVAAALGLTVEYTELEVDETEPLGREYGSAGLCAVELSPTSPALALAGAGRAAAAAAALRYLRLALSFKRDAGSPPADRAPAMEHLTLGY